MVRLKCRGRETTSPVSPTGSRVVDGVTPVDRGRSWTDKDRKLGLRVSLSLSLSWSWSRVGLVSSLVL